MHTAKQIELRGEVGGPDFNIRLVHDALDGAGAVQVVIDSGGGCSITGHAIYQALIEHDGPVTVEIVKCGSAAVAPALAGRKRTIRGSGCFFLHRTWGATIGTANTLRRALKTQSEWDAVIAKIYSERTGQSLDQVYELMDRETTLGAKQAVKLGFAHEITGPVQSVKHDVNLDQTALACLNIEKKMKSPVMTQFRQEAKPTARHDPLLKAILDRPTQKPKIPRDKAGEALERFVENERREAEIRRGLAARLRRVIDRNGRIDWPVRVDWICSTCGETNYGPPEKNMLATPCAHCGATTKE